MRLVDRETFLKLPSGTVYCKFPLNGNRDMSFMMTAPSIKGDTVAGIDFFTSTLGEDFTPKGDADIFDTFFAMQHNLGVDVPFELSGGRDGMFDDESVGFMVFNKNEVSEMIDELKECLEKAY